jgi:acyl-ACP--UDP-N-acetylglucosamine O-acyltransferase
MDNKIEQNVLIGKNFIIGDNNLIHSNVIIYDNVKIGNNNIIYDNVIIYPNTIIGDNNIVYNGNIIGEYPIQADGTFKDYNFNKTKGVIIGNNNFFHVKNMIFCGTEKNTIIGNNNKILCDCHINHDCYIGNNVTLYPRVTLAGFVNCLDYSSIGGSSFIHQKKTIGQYSMVGANNFVGRNVFPYFVFINNKITRLNYIKLSDEVIKNEDTIKSITTEYYKKNDIVFENIPEKIKNNIEIFIKYCNCSNI